MIDDDTFLDMLDSWNISSAVMQTSHKDCIKFTGIFLQKKIDFFTGWALGYFSSQNKKSMASFNTGRFLFKI